MYKGSIKQKIWRQIMVKFEGENYKLYNGDCLEISKQRIEKYMKG